LIPFRRTYVIWTCSFSSRRVTSGRGEALVGPWPAPVSTASITMMTIQPAPHLPPHHTGERDGSSWSEAESAGLLKPHADACLHMDASPGPGAASGEEARDLRPVRIRLDTTPYSSPRPKTMSTLSASARGHFLFGSVIFAPLSFFSRCGL
jgi:hypothetical protein